MDAITCDDCGASVPVDASACVECGSTSITHRLSVNDTLSVSVNETRATSDSRMSLTLTFLQSAVLAVREAYTLEVIAGERRDDALVIEHRRNVLTAIMLSASALEAEAFETARHGPGHHLGTNKLNEAGKALLGPKAEDIDRQPTLERYETMLRLLAKPAIDRGRAIWCNADLAIWLRNELVHYKSQWNSALEDQRKENPEVERARKLQVLRSKRHKPPRYVQAESNFFPEKCLSAACAAWCVKSLVAFLDAFYTNAGIESPLRAIREDAAKL